MKIPKRIWAQEVARKLADFWESCNETQRRFGHPEFTLDKMLASAWLKGFEAGRRDEKQRKKERGNSE